MTFSNEYPGEFLVDFSLENNGRKNPPQNPRQNSNQNLGVSRSKSALQESAFEKFGFSFERETSTRVLANFSREVTNF